MFIDKFLLGHDSSRLWALRCALLHTYGLSKAMEKAKLSGYSFQHKNSENHKKLENDIYWLNLSDFLFDVIKSTHDFFNYLKSKDESELLKYLNNLNIINVRDDSTGKIIYFKKFGKIDDILSPLDDPIIDWDLLRTKIDDLCHSK